MSQTTYDSKEIIRRGREIYEQQVRRHVEPEHKGKFLALDIETGEYEIDREDIAAIKRAKAKRSEAVLYILRVGYPTAYKLGGRLAVEQG